MNKILIRYHNKNIDKIVKKKMETGLTCAPLKQCVLRREISR